MLYALLYRAAPPRHAELNPDTSKDYLRIYLLVWTFLLGVFLLLSGTPTWAAKKQTVSYETLTFVESDGRRYTNYTTTRSDVPEYNVFLSKSESLEDFLYINPNDYTVDRDAAEANILRFDQGSYALMSQGDYIDDRHPERSLLVIDRHGLYTLSTWNGIKHGNGHYGIWNSPTDFESFAAAWVLPEQFDIVAFHSNAEGEWVQRGNTLAFFGNNVNNVTFEISYKPKSSETYRAMKDALAEIEAVDVQQSESAVTIIMTNEILFPSGSANLSSHGRELLANVASSLDDPDGFNVIVEGHTDDVPITGELTKRFPTNWELSAGRALNVVHALSGAGLPPERLQARAFGPFQPRMANVNEISRRANRRIELIIEPR